MLKDLRTAVPVCLHDIVRYKNVAGSAWLERNTAVPVPGSCHSSGRAAGEFAGHPSGAPPDVARNRNVPDRLHGIDSSPANSRRARKRGKKVDGDTGTRTAALC